MLWRYCLLERWYWRAFTEVSAVRTELQSWNSSFGKLDSLTGVPLKLAACVRKPLWNSLADNKLGDPSSCSCLILFGLVFLFGFWFFLFICLIIGLELNKHGEEWQLLKSFTWEVGHTPVLPFLFAAYLVLFWTLVSIFFLQQVLHSIAVVTENVSIFRMEKLYAVLSQCIYQHREDGDKNELVKVIFFVL